MEVPISFGSGVSLRTSNDLGAYIASPGFADPRLVVRRRERPSFPLLQFDRCVFRFQFPPQHGNRSKKLLNNQKNSQTQLTYGRTVCLVHAYSGLYVTVVHKPADGNSNHFSLALMSQDDAGSACKFRVMPRYKIRTEGDRVYDKDMIYLQQESSMLSIHAPSSAALGIDETECSASAEDATSFEVDLYDDVEQLEHERHPPLRAGCASLIFHREKDAILTLSSRTDGLNSSPRDSGSSSPTAPGSSKRFNAIASSGSASNLICFRHYDKAVTNLSPDQLEYGCNALWFFENVDPAVGGVIEANCPFRIRHGASGHYLTHLEGPEIGFSELNSTEALEASVFELELVSSAGTGGTMILSAKSFVRLRHRSSCCYLSSRRVHHQPTSVLTLTQHPNLEDTITILMVPRKRQQELCYLIGNVEFLSNYIKMFYNMQDPYCQLRPQDALVTRVVQRAATSLSALICFCTESDDDDPLTREGLPIPNHQQSMFEVQLHKIVMDVLLCPFVSAGKENKMELPIEGGVLSIKNLLDDKLEHIYKVCRLCYRLLKQMSKGSPFAGQLVEYVSFMQAQEGYKLHVADTQLEIFTNNPNIPAERCEANVRHFVNLLLTKERSSGYLRFLSSLCVVNGTGVPNNQSLVSSLLLDQHRDKIFYRTETRDGVLMILVPPSTGKKKKAPTAAELLAADVSPSATPPQDAQPKWLPLQEFLKAGEPKMIKFFESSVELLGNLVIGGETSSVELVRSFVSQDHIAAAVDPEFACSEFLRASYFNLALHLYTREMLSRQVGRQLTPLRTCGALVRQKDPAPKPDVPLSPQRAADTTTVATRLPAALGTVAQAEAFLANIKSRALIFIKQQREKEGSELILVLSHIWHSIVMYEAYTHDELVDAVHAVISFLDTSQQAKSADRYKRSEDTENSMRTKQGLCTLLKTVLDHELTRITDLVLSDVSMGAPSPSSLTLATQLIEELKATFLQVQLLPILRDLMFYENATLVATAVDLALALCNAKGKIADRVRGAEVVSNPTSKASFDVFAKVQRELIQNFSATGKVINEEALIASVREVTTFDPNKFAEGVGGRPRGNSLMSPSRRVEEASKADDDNEDENDVPPTAASGARASRTLSERFQLRVMTVIALQRTAAVVSEKRQRWRRSASNLGEYSRLLFRSELHILLLRVLRADSSPEVQEMLLEFFRIFCISDVSAQALAPNLSAFLPFLHNPATSLDAAAIVLRVVEVSPWLADKLEESTITQLTNLLTQTKDPIIAEGLEHAVLGEYPVARNQALVVGALIDAKVIMSFVSQDVATDLTAAQLAYRSACVDLVSCCCVNNSACRSQVSQLIKADELIAVLEQSSLPAAHLVPYYKLLTAAFLSTEEDLTAQELQHKKRLWADNAKWWKLVDGRMFSLLTVEDDGTHLDADIVFLGVIPLLVSYFTFMFGAVQCAKSKVAMPLSRVIRKIVQFGEVLYKHKDTLLDSEYRNAAVHQLVSALLNHIDTRHEQFGALSTLQANIHALLSSSQQKVAAAATPTPQASQQPGTNSNSEAMMSGAELFESWKINSEEALKPFLLLMSSDGDGSLYKSPQQQPVDLLLHQILVKHLSLLAFSDEIASGVMAMFRHSIVQYEEGAPHFVEAQNYMNSIGAVKMVTEIAFETSEEAGSEAFQLAIAVLEGGNKTVQDQLLNFFTSTDERFFHETSLNISLVTRTARQQRAREAYLTFYASSKTRSISFGNLEANLRFLQLMCEGHHLGLQDYLREQQDNLRSVNVVKDIVRLLQELVLHDVDEQSFPIILQTLNVLTEFCQGPCVGNQKLLASSGACQSINTIMTSAAFAATEPLNQDHSEKMISLKHAAVTLLLALLEGNVDDSIASVILFEIPMHNLTELTRQLIESPEFMTASSEDVCEVVYSLMIAAHTIVNSTSGLEKMDTQPMIEEAKKLLKTYSSYCGMLGKIEIERYNRIERVYFRVPTICSLLTEDQRQKLLWALDRSTQGSKLSDFLDKIDEMIFDLEATHRVTQKMTDNKAFMLVAKWPLSRWDDLSLLIAVVMNLLFVVVMEDANGLLDKHIDWFGVEGIIRLCAYAQLGVSVLIAVMDGSLNFPLILYKQSKEIEHPTIFQKFGAIFRRNETLYRWTAVTLAFMGFLFSDFFFAFHLLGLITKSSVLKNVVVAVTTNGRSLLLTGMLGCILVYLFSIIGFVMFQDHFDEACSSLNTCVLHILTSGLRQGGGIGDRMKEVKYGEPMYLRRTLYDFLFWAIMIVIFLNILFGIIIDTFAELRDDKSKKEEDMRTKCLICGIDSYTFDRYGSGFTAHVKLEHNMWQYLYFLHHLRRKEATEYTGQESYVAQCVANGDISFFPAGKCTSLKNVPLAGDSADGGDDADLDAADSSRSIADKKRDDRKVAQNGGAASTDKFGSGGPVEMSQAMMLFTEQTSTALAKIMLRLENIEKSSSLLLPSSTTGGAANFTIGRFGRLESNLSTRSDGATSPPRTQNEQQAWSRHLLEADHTHQANLHQLKLEHENSRRLIFTDMGELMEQFSLFFQSAQSLASIYAKSKEEVFVACIKSQQVLLCSKLGELSRLSAMSDSFSPLLIREQQRDVESRKVRSMIEAMAASPRRGSTSTSDSAEGSPKVDDNIDALMQQGKDYMLMLRQMTAETRAAHAAGSLSQNAVPIVRKN